MTKQHFRHIDPSVAEKDPYQFCSAGRNKFGDDLLSLVRRTDRGCTLALNGAWGTGKTTFLRMWEQQLRNAGHSTIYLNAWETDWAEDPLIALLACVTKACSKSPDQKTIIDKISTSFQNFRKDPTKLLLSAGSAVLQRLTNVDSSSVFEEINNLSKKAFDDSILSFNDKVDAMKDIKDNLEKLAWDSNQAQDQQLLVFIIDELDRCKPDYAVRMLEILKHFFAVPNIFFVCGIDRKHLGDSICGYYGNPYINAEEYLRRFFDLEIDLRQPDYRKFCEHLYDYYGFSDFYETKDRKDCAGSQDEPEIFKSFISMLARKEGLTLRQLERVFAYSRLALGQNGYASTKHVELIIFITFLRFFDRSFYDGLKTHRYTAQEVSDLFSERYGKIVDPKDMVNNPEKNYQRLKCLLALLLVAYTTTVDRDDERVYDEQSKKALVTSTVFTDDNFGEMLGFYSRNSWRFHLSSLFPILDLLKIDIKQKTSV